jgi:hypothetical protein
MVASLLTYVVMTSLSPVEQLGLVGWSGQGVDV